MVQLTNFIKDLYESRMIRSEGDLKLEYSEVCANLFLTVLTIDFLSRTQKGLGIAKEYANRTASYINYSEFRSSATDLYNLIYFVQANPSTVEKLFNSEDSKKLREITHLPRMELNRWLMKIDSEHVKDLYFFSRLEQALHITDSSLKDIRRMLQIKSLNSSDVRTLASKILAEYRRRIPTFDLRNQIEQVLTAYRIEMN